MHKTSDTDYYFEPGKKIPVLGKYDVIVVGGGPAGCAAAISAARKECSVLLVEKDGYLGRRCGFYECSSYTFNKRR